MAPLQEPICQALNLSDGQRCSEVAVVWDNLFCRFHGKQCHGLYAGYKKRNAELDGLAGQAPDYLKSRDTPLANETFEHVGDENVLNEIHSHLFKEYVLLGKVIDARKLHHKHFYPLKLDYGHQSYLDTLSNRRHIVLRALERVVKRTAEVLYAKEKWFEWVEEVQHQEESKREKEAKKVKLEAAMFKRHWKKMQTRLRAQREKEEKQRQEAFLETVYQERISAATDSDEDAEMWDPIEDFIEDEKSRYVDLIKYFLWMEVLNEGDEDEEKQTAPPATDAELTAEAQKLSISNTASTKKSKKKPKSKDPKSSNAAINKLPQSHNAGNGLTSGRAGQTKILDMMNSKDAGRKAIENNPEPDKSNIETEEEMRKRLKEGVEKNYDDVYGPILVGSLETPHGTYKKTPPLEDDEIDTLMQDIKEIKILLFCRLLLSHASLLPAALRATSVEDFLNDTEITEADLRDICLQVEQPSLQDIRDACADLLRGDEPETEEELDDDIEDLSVEDIIMHNRRYGRLQGAAWYYMNMLAAPSKFLGEPAISLKDFLKPAMKQNKKMKIQICGKSIWNYSSESSMSREGWLQFSVLAKGCDLRHAVQLCRNWAEFSELNALASWQYFPASNWVSWGTDRLTKQLHDLGFFPFFLDLGAENLSHHFQAGGSRTQQRRRHEFVESRNILVGHMKRNDSVTRRFLQYISMRPGDLLLLVRDGRTGTIVTAPRDEDTHWTLRSKQGLGRASKNEWEVHLEIGPEYFDFVERNRNWHLGFDDFYEVWIWHFVPGQSGQMLYNVVVEELRRAWRIAQPRDMYNHQEAFLRTLTRNQNTQRVRPIKPGEQAKSLWDEVRDPRNIFILTDVTNRTTKTFQGDSTPEAVTNQFYNEADAEEDAILFPDELVAPNPNVPFKEVSNPITRLEDGAGAMNKYLLKMSMQGRRARRPLRLSGENSDSDESLESGDDDFDPDDTASNGKLIEPPSGEDVEVIKHWRLPRLWEDQITNINKTRIDAARMKTLSNVGLLDLRTGMARKGPSDVHFAKNLEMLDQMMLFEKDRGSALLKAFHDGDLEPGAPEKYKETCAIIEGILNQAGAGSSQAWFWFVLEMLEWLQVRINYTDYSHDMTAPWPHPFITQDALKAWAYMAIFFPNLEQCRPAADFFKSKEGQQYQQSPLRDPHQRASTLPDRRSKTSFKWRPKEFWKEWADIVADSEKTGTYCADAMPMKWKIALRPMLAKLYLAGIISPALMQNSPLVCSGWAIANTEPHRPDKLDLFIDYTDPHKAMRYPSKIPGLIRPDEFPVFLPLARAFAAKNPRARFAILRLWSAPHFYPAMLGDSNRIGTAFLDSMSRAWRWNFIPKDTPLSEWSMYNNLKIRLELIKKQLGDRVAHRDDVVLVMGTDQLDLLRLAVAVTFAIQTKPWFREFDLWRSFVNVDVEFLEGLDPVWLN